VANGEGYLRKRGGSWTMTVFLGKDETGKPRQLVKTMKGTEKEAQAEMARLIAERNQGVDLKPETVTFNELTRRWLEMKTPESVYLGRGHLRAAAASPRSTRPRRPQAA
jgi:hypothetical protein